MTVDIICADARDALTRFPDGHFDCIITSPPYNIGRDYGSVSDSMPDGEFRAFSGDWLREALRVCREGSRAYVVVSQAMLFWFRDVAEAAGWRYGQLLFWCKPNFSSTTTGRISGDWNHMTEPIFLLRKGKRTPMLTGGKTTTFDWFVAASPQSNFTDKRIHPAQFAEALVARLLSRTPSTRVLDPFAGSGTVGKIATAFGKDAVLIEKNPEYCEMARHRTAQRGLMVMTSQDGEN